MMKLTVLWLALSVVAVSGRNDPDFRVPSSVNDDAGGRPWRLSTAGAGGGRTKDLSGQPGDAVSTDRQEERELKSNCKYVKVFLKFKQVQKQTTASEIVTVVDKVPVYQKNSRKLIGTWTQSVIKTGEDDCTTNVTIRRKKKGDILYLQGSCFASDKDAWAVVGGSGAYACARGSLKVGSKSDKRVFYVIKICGGGC